MALRLVVVAHSAQAERSFRRKPNADPTPSRTNSSAPEVGWRDSQPFLLGFFTVCLYVVLGLFLTVLDLTNLPVFALLFTVFFGGTIFTFPLQR
jgi:hypothetical protein